MFSRGLIRRMRYRHGIPFITSAFLAFVATAGPIVRNSRFNEGTKIWEFAILITISTAFALLCGGRFRTFFVAIAVTPPFLFLLGVYCVYTFSPWSDFQVLVEFFLYFVAAPILLVWLVTTLLNREKSRP